MVIITGASGLVGSYLCIQLQKKNIPFKGIIRKGSSLHLLQEIHPENLVYGDLLEPESLEEHLAEASIIVHSAAIISFDPTDYPLMNQVNIEGTRDLVNLALKYPIKKFIHISSISAIPLNKSEDIATEKNTWPGSSQPSQYGVTKFHSEVEVMRANAEGLPTIILNPVTILGPGEENRSSTRLFHYVWEEKKFYTAGNLNFLDLRDFVEVIITFIENDIVNEKFIVNGGQISYFDFFKMIAKYFNKKAPTIKATPFMLEIALFIEWFKSKITGRPPLVTRETAMRGNSNVIYDTSKLLKVVPISFRSIDDTVKWTCSELKNDFEN